MRRFGKLSAGLFAAMFMMNGATAWAGDTIGTIYQGGKIYTMQEAKVDASNRLIPLSKDTEPVMAEFVVTEGGKIVYVGKTGEAIPEKYLTGEYKKVDLNGKTMYPGFIDGHSHFPNQGTDDLYKVNLNSPLYDGPVTDIATLKSEIKKRADLLKSQGHTDILVEGYNYDDTKLAEMRHPTAADLDEACADLPVFIKHISGHVAVANTKALELCKVAEAVAEDPVKYAGVAMKDGKPTGLLNETAAMGLVTAARAASFGNTISSVAKDAQAEVARATQVYAAAGVTTADNGGSMMFGDMLTWQNAVANGNLGLRLVAHPFGYFYYPGYGEFGFQNRRALGWTDDGTNEYKTPSADSPAVGDDITKTPIYSEYPGYGVVQINGAQCALPLPENRLFLGAWKFIFDGSPQAYTAWMKAPGNYDLGSHSEADEDKTNFDMYEGFNGLPGTMNMSAEDLAKYIELYHSHGQATETHTNGSGAAEAWLAAVEATVQKYGAGISDTRHTSIHGQTLERQHIERMTGNYADLATTKNMYTDLMGAGGKTLAEVGNLPELMKAQNIFCSFFNNHVYFYGDRHHDIFFGPGRAMNISPVGWAQAYGMPYSFHNDTDVTPISPLRSITTAVTRLTSDGKLLSKAGETDLDATVEYNALKGKDETKTKYWAYDHRITALQALHAVTMGPAWQNKIEDRVGSIEVGKLADFTIMHKDIIAQAEEDPTKIATMPVATTIVGDEVIYGVLPDAQEFAFAPAPGFEQPAGFRPNIMKDETAPLDKETVQAEFSALPKGENLLGAMAISAQVQQSTVSNGQTTWIPVKTEGTNVVFSFSILGNGDTIDKLGLFKLKKGVETIPFANYRDLSTPLDLTSEDAEGVWWIADSIKPLEALSADTELKMDHVYFVNFVIRDGGQFDEDDVPGQITDPVALTTETDNIPANQGEDKTGESEDQPGEAPKPEAPEDNKTSGGSDGGCTVGTNPAYELFALLLASLGVMAGRIFRRRENA